MWTKLALANVKRKIEIGWLAAALVSLSAPVWAQAAEGEDDLGEDTEGEAAASPAEPADEPAEEAEPKAPAPPLPTKMIANPVAPPSPFTLSVRGVISGSMYMQDLPMRAPGNNGGSAVFGAVGVQLDKWFLGGDVRQSQLQIGVRGPEVLGGAIPYGAIEFDMLGGSQIATVPNVPFLVRDSMGAVIGSVPGFTSSAQGDESLLPRVRLAYVELNWGAGTDIVRAGQFHNLLLPMIAASGSHIGVPLGYGAGQLGWRAPGITYLHRFALSQTTSLTGGIQINRNSWRDNDPPCAAMQVPSQAAPCVPSGAPPGTPSVSIGEASMLPQVEARLVLSGPPAPSPFPMYAPNAWQVHLVGHWDVKDVSGIGADAVPPMVDSMTTMLGEAGFKVTLGPVLLAANAWYGKNAGGVFGHIFQMQVPGAGDISGFGAWGQLGLSLTKNLSVWGFFGTDVPSEADIRVASPFGAYLSNTQISAMVSYVDGPIALTLEYLRISTNQWSPARPAVGMMPATPDTELTTSANQIALTMAYFFY